MPTGAEITCYECGGAFDERALEGSWLERRCPLCSARLSEEGYDAAARDVLARHRPQLGKRGKKKLERLACARYYASEWFRLACPGQGSEAADKGLFGLEPCYDLKTGAFDLVPVDGDRSPEGGWGVSAEYFVFDALRAEIVREGSPLAGALLVPHLMFPWLPGQKPKQWGAKQRSEIDCVVLMDACAVVVEVKRRSHHVRVAGDFRHIRERTETGSFRSSSEPVEQVGRGADSLAERQRLYPPERIYKMIVYVDPPSFECEGTRFRDGWFAGCLERGARPAFLDALCELADELDPIADEGAVRALARELLGKFGNTAERRQGGIVVGQGPGFGKGMRLTGAFLDSVAKLARTPSSPLHGARLLTNLVCEVQVGSRKGEPRFKRENVPGLLLTRSHAILVSVKCWPVHVNTHVPFATVYTGDPKRGAEHVEDAIRHDWDLDGIGYLNRSGSLTLLKYVSKSLQEIDCYRDRNRVYTLNVFANPASFYSDCADFRQKTFIGFWKRGGGNVAAALEQLAASSTPVLTQAQLDRLADRISSIGEEGPGGQGKAGRSGRERGAAASPDADRT